MGKDPWEGGYIRHGKKGPTYVIEREVGGERFHISTRCRTRRSALKQLERFEASPLAYRPQGDEDDSHQREPIHLTETLVEEFTKWQIHEKHNTRKHSKEMGNRLTDWMEDLGAVDLRETNLRDHIIPALEKRDSNRKHRIIALKSFYAWLRTTKHVLTSADDPTLDLKVPQAVPEKQRRRKALARERVLLALAKLEGAHRDCLLLLMATGMHVTELERFARDDESHLVELPRGAPGLAVLVVRHKSGEPYRVTLQHQEHVDAAVRLRARRSIPRRLNHEVKAACRDAKVEPFTLGVMRHSVATWAVEDGADPRDVSQFLNHKDPRTTARFYTDVAAPSIRVPVLRVVDGGKS